MRPFLDEACLLEAATPPNRCPTTDQLDLLDANPHWRLALEDSWTAPDGRVYTEVPADRQSRWPTHLSRAFRPLLRISRDPEQVFQLLDLLNELDADEAVLRMTLAGCRKRGSLKPAIDYYTKLNDELDAVSGATSENEFPLGTHEPRCRPRVEDGEVVVGSWHCATDTHEDDEPRLAPSYRPDLLHDPSCAYNTTERDWIARQPARWRTLYAAIRRAKASALPRHRERLLALRGGSWSRSQMQVLWETYIARRDYLRRCMEHATAHRMGPSARALVRRIERIRTEREARWVGHNLHRCMKGELPINGSVKQCEWAVIFSSYRARKTEIAQTHE